MKVRLPRRTVAVVVAVSGFGIGFTVSAAATGSSSSSSIFGCLHSGTLSKVSTSSHSCPAGSTEISWNEVGATNYQLAQENGYKGTLGQWLASLVGPKGVVGPPGVQGPLGPEGPVGATNYQLAVQDGFTGTVAQWLASLVGPRGPVGATGSLGPAGSKGSVGATGPKGPTGGTGVKGATGSTGARGSTGATGSPGPTGGLSDVWVISGSSTFGCFSSCNFDSEIATGKTLPAGTYVISANLDVTVGDTYTPANFEAGASCFLGVPEINFPTVLLDFPATGELTEGGSAHVFLASTVTLSSDTTVSVFCPAEFTLYGLTASTSVTATPVTTVH